MELRFTKINYLWCKLEQIAFALMMVAYGGAMVHYPHQPLTSEQVKWTMDDHVNALWPEYLPNNRSVANMTFLKEEPDVCDIIRPNATLLIYVHSAPAHFKNRAQIRQSYGSSAMYRKFGSVTLFLIGRSDDQEVGRALTLESDRYHDIIMGDYSDDGFQSQTMKAISALVWITKHCKQVPYVLKTEDDILVNVFNVVRHVMYLTKYDTDPSSGGHIHCNVTIAMSDVINEGNVEVNLQSIPDRCSSSAFLMPGSLIPMLHDAIARVPIYWQDNVYVTGFLRVATGLLELNNIASVIADTTEEYESKKDTINKDGLFGRLSGEKGLELMRVYWDDICQKHQYMDN